MTLRTDGGSLLIDSGSLANSADCCCEEECTAVSLPDDCECIPSDYGAIEDVGDAVVTISGTTSGGSCCGVNWAGSYTVACGTGSRWHAARYCTTSVSDFYAMEELVIGFITGSEGLHARKKVTVTFFAYQFAIAAGSPNPCPSITAGPASDCDANAQGDFTTAKSSHQRTYLDDTTYLQYSCSNRTDLTQNARGCVSSLPESSTTGYLPGGVYDCDWTGLTISVAIT